MKNEHAIVLKKAADKYLAWHNKAFEGDSDMIEFGKKDYDDLISIAGMIENGEDVRKIGKAMWNLDTAVRDVIPDDVFYAYNQ